MRQLLIIALVTLGIAGSSATAHASTGWKHYRDHYVQWHTPLVAPPIFPDAGPAPFNRYAAARARAIRRAEQANDRYRAARLKAARAAAATQPSPSRTTSSARPTSSFSGSVPDLIRSIFGRIAPGRVAVALCIADRESGFDPGADNSRSTAGGVFQFLVGTWLSLTKRYDPLGKLGLLGSSRYSAVPNVTIAAYAMADPDVGLAPWGGGC